MKAPVVASISGTVWAMKAPVVASISGTVWTVIAAFILWQPEFWGRFHEVRWLACAAGPLVGLALYFCSRWSYKKMTAVRVAWAVISLYLAAGVYGLVLGLLVWPSRSANTTAEAIFEPVLACWWGITVIPFLWPLFGLSFLNHQFLRRYEVSAHPQNRGGTVLSNENPA